MTDEDAHLPGMDVQLDAFGWTPGLAAGVDEAGRGPLAGPVVAAAVILDPQRPVQGLRDSKKLTAKVRAELEAEIKTRALTYCVAEASVREIDTLNILRASLLAMERAVRGLTGSPDVVYVDGNQLPQVGCPAVALVKGDDRLVSISAASVLAKEHRDRAMRAWAEDYPHYDFAQNKGYGTRAHLQALAKYGPTPIHRQSFAPVAASRPSDTPQMETMF